MQGIPSYGQIWRISLPIILSLIAQNIINVTDTAFLGRLGEIELGASAIGGLVYISIYMLGFGFATGVQILAGRRNGQQAFGEIGPVVMQGFYALLLFAAAFLLLFHLVLPGFLSGFVASEAVGQATGQFLSIRIWGIVPAFMNVNFRAFFVGTTQTRVLGYTSAVMAGCNVVLDYALIFGHFGLPAMGIEGAALASVISETAGTIFFFTYTLYFARPAHYNLFRDFRLRPKLIVLTLGLSVWVMLQNFASLGGWLIFFVIIEKTGETNLAVSNIIRSIYLVLMIPVWGFATSVSTIVSNSMGSHGPAHVMGIIRKTARLSAGILTGVAILAALLPRYLLQVYTPDPELVQTGLPLVYLISGVMPLFAVSIAFFHGLTGTGNTRISMAIEILTILIYLAATWYLAIAKEQPLWVVWTTEYLYFVLLGGLSWLYLKTGHWKKKIL